MASVSQDTAQRDPRSIVTPDAFDVSDALLGMPLATPGTRLIAMGIDLAVIGFLTVVTRSFALVLGVVAAALFIRAGFKHTSVRGSVFDRAMRGSVGCLGVLIAIVTAALWASFGPGGRGDGPITVEGEGVRTAVLDTLGAPRSGAPAESVEPRDVTAAIPLLNETASSAPSSAATRSSSKRAVGLP
jgi:hypothetical protein